MSELNRLLSDLSSLEERENKLTLVTIPSAWGFRLARIALALFGTLAGASSIAWAISSTDFSALSRNFVDEPAVLFDSRDGPVEPKIQKYEPQIRPLTSKSKAADSDVIVTPILLPPPAPLSELLEDTSPSSLLVESVTLSGEQLATIAYDKAQEKAQEGDTQRAIAYLYDALKYNGSNVLAINQLAGLLYGRNQIREAESVLRNGIKTNPTSATLRLTLARMYQQTGREESALIVLIAAEDILVDDPVNLVSMRAALAQKFGRLELAKDSYQWLTEKEPMDGRWWLGLGVAAERENAYGQAGRAYQEAVKAGGLSDQAVDFARQRILYLQTLSQQEVPASGN